MLTDQKLVVTVILPRHQRANISTPHDSVRWLDVCQCIDVKHVRRVRPEMVLLWPLTSLINRMFSVFRTTPVETLQTGVCSSSLGKIPKPARVTPTEVAGMSSAFWCWTRTLTYPRGFTQRHTGVPNKAEGERIWWYLQPLYSNIFPFLVFWGLFMYRSSYMKRGWEDVSSGSVHHGSSERNAPGPLCVFMDVFFSFKSFYLCRCTRRRFL